MKSFLRLVSISVLFMVSACSVTSGCDDYHSYRYVKAQNPLEVPANLEQPVNESTAPKATADPNKVDRNAAGECLEKPPTL